MGGNICYQAHVDQQLCVLCEQRARHPRMCPPVPSVCTSTIRSNTKKYGLGEGKKRWVTI